MDPEKAKKNRQVIVWTAVALIGCIIALIVFISIQSGGNGKDDGEVKSVSMELPEGEQPKMSGSKMEGYALAGSSYGGGDVDFGSSADDIWQSLATDELKKKDSAVSASASMGGYAEKMFAQAGVDRKVTEEEVLAAREAASGNAGDRKKPSPKKVDTVVVVAVDSSVAASDGDAKKFRHKAYDDGWGGEEISSIGGDYEEYSNTMEPVKAMFTKAEKIQNGQRISIRLLEDMVVDGVQLDANSHLTATCTIGNGRMSVVVAGFALNGEIHSVNLVGYDNDGSEGIYCPMSEKEENVNIAADAAINLGANALSQSIGLGNLGSQATQTGAQLIRKGKSKVTVAIPSGYTFYLLSVEK